MRRLRSGKLCHLPRLIGSESSRAWSGTQASWTPNLYSLWSVLPVERLTKSFHKHHIVSSASPVMRQGEFTTPISQMRSWDSERWGQSPKVTWLAIRTQVSCQVPAQGHAFFVPPPRDLSHSQATLVPAKNLGVACSACHSPQIHISSLFLGAKAPGWLRAWLYQVHSSLRSGLGMWGEAPAPHIGNLPTEPPSFLLESALEFLCSQCISLEVCPLRVAMVTILVLHARKSRGTCWSHHQNLSLWKISRWHLSEIPTSWLIWEKEECVAMLISFNLDWLCRCFGEDVKSLCTNPTSFLWSDGLLSSPREAKKFGDLNFSRWKQGEDHDVTSLLRGVRMLGPVLQRFVSHF